MNIIIGSDHAAINLRLSIIQHLTNRGIQVQDMGVPQGTDSSDYPDIAANVCTAVLQQDNTVGILLCGTGIGMSIAANKHSGIRCALCSDTFSAKMSKLHNNANVLAIGERVVGLGLAIDIVDSYINTDFSNEDKHIRRLKKLKDQKQ